MQLRILSQQIFLKYCFARLCYNVIIFPPPKFLVYLYAFEQFACFLLSAFQMHSRFHFKMASG